MNRHTLSTIVRVGVIVALATTTLFALPHVKQVHPSSGNPPVFLAVLADHYAADQEEEFNQDVENFFNYGLLVDGDYDDWADKIKIVRYFEPTPMAEESIYDFKIEPNVGNCAVVDGPKTLDKIKTTLGTAMPVHTIVLGNYPYSFGCTDDQWTYIAVDAIGTDVVPHEMGHVLGDLFDEWSLPRNKNRPYDKIIQMNDTRNCWPVPASNPPHWMNNTGQFPGAKFVWECDLFGKRIVHPYDQCRMGVHSDHPPKFCKVCAAEMDSVFDYYRTWQRLLSRARSTDVARPRASHDTTPRYGIVNAAFVEQPSVTPDVEVKIMKVTVRIDPNTRVISGGVKRFGTGFYVPSYRRNGHILYEYQVDDVMVEVGVIPDHLFTARGYRGGATHGTSDAQAREIEIAIPNEDAATIKDTRKQTLTLYEIPDTLTTERFITPLNFPAIKSQLTQMGSPMSIK